MQKWKNVSAHGDLFHVIAANNTGGYRINFSDNGLHSTYNKVPEQARQAGRG